MNKEKSPNLRQPIQSGPIVLDGVFRKSSSSGGGGCVEVAKRADGTVKVRDTKNRTEVALTFTHNEWRAFLQGVRAGEFDIE